MALNAAISPPRAGSPKPRVLGIAFGALLWAIFVAMALRTSRFPVVFHRYSKEYAALLLLVLATATIVTMAQLPRVFAVLDGRRHILLWLFLFCPLLIFASVEGAMRLFNLLGSDFYSEIRRYMTVLVLDGRLFFKNPPLYRGIYQGVEVTTNELGFRERPLRPHATGSARILILGDSVAFGWGVSVEDAFPRQLERRLQLSWGAPIETINSGVPGYNTGQELAVLQLYGDRLQPDAVLLLYVDNDIDAIDPARVHMGVPANPWENPGGAADYFLSMSRFYFMLRHIVPVFAGRRASSLAERRQTPGWQNSMTSLQEMARICHSRGTPLAVFHFRMMDDRISGALNEELENHARAEDFYFCDTLAWFSGRNIRRLTNSFIDTHPNAEGHRLLTEGMSRFLLDRSVLRTVFGSSTADRPGRRTE
jgi:lysophospholipase L1-like esterase